MQGVFSPEKKNLQDDFSPAVNHSALLRPSPTAQASWRRNGRAAVTVTNSSASALRSHIYYLWPVNKSWNKAPTVTPVRGWTDDIIYGFKLLSLAAPRRAAPLQVSIRLLSGYRWPSPVTRGQLISPRKSITMSSEIFVHSTWASNMLATVLTVSLNMLTFMFA